MAKIRRVLSAQVLASVGLLAFSTVSTVASAAEPEKNVKSGGKFEEVVVTATRREEKIKDVPMSITAISGELLSKNNLTNFTDVAQVSSGLVLATTSQGQEASLRGVSTSVVSGAPPAVDIYFNEAPLNASIAFQSMYDIGQVEVLRGPQGTLRGNTAPAGAVTITTKRPVLNEFGGNVNVQLSRREESNFNTQVALNIPLIEDRLAMRVAAMSDNNDGAGTKNVSSGVHTDNEQASGRVSLLLEATDRFEIFTAFQYMRNASNDLARVEGNGIGYNGPHIDGSSNLAVQEATNYSLRTSRIGSLIMKYDFDAATLNYILGYSHSEQAQHPGDVEGDFGNSVLNSGREPDAYSYIPFTSWTQELRLDSSGSDRFVDYTIGAYRTNGGANVHSHSPLLPFNGAFGNPAAPSSGTPTGPIHERYIAHTDLHLYGGDNSMFGSTSSQSAFGSLTFNLPTRTHIRTGARRVWATQTQNFVLTLPAWNVAAPVPFPTSLCSAIIPKSSASPEYPTSCDIPVAGATLIDSHNTNHFTAWVYDLDVSQNITDDLMAYANFSHNWRGPGSSQGDVPIQYISVQPEKSDNFEVGIKASLFDKRVLVTAAAFQQDFKGYNASVSNIPFLSATGAEKDAFSITYNGDARVRGFETDIQALLTDNWTMGLGASYAKSNFKNALTPCRDANFDGRPDGGSPTAAQFIAAGVNVATCKSNGPISGLPNGSVNLQSEYTIPLQAAELYGRALVNWRSEGEIISSNSPIDSYTTVNLYAGARKLAGGNMEVGAFVKNAFDRTVRYDQGGDLTFLQINSGYRQVWYTPGREYGVSMRYTFGPG